MRRGANRPGFIRQGPNNRRAEGKGATSIVL